MERRSGATPMEFEYDNKGGQVDLNSPWLRNTTNRLASFGNQNYQHSFASPKKQPSPTRIPAQQSKPLPQTPTMKPPSFFSSSFAGIRESKNQDFSSGPDNQSSPDNADNEDTPEPTNRRGQVNINDNVTINRGHTSPSKRTSLSEMFNFRRFSPGRSGIRKRHDRDILAKKVHKRKRRELEKDDRIPHRRGSDESSSEDLYRPAKVSVIAPQQAFIPALMKAIVDHPTLPHILTWYVQLLWNFCSCLFVMYVVYCFWASIRSDVYMKAQEEAAKIMVEIQICLHDYTQNQCGMNTRVPAMQMQCEKWEACMKRDPDKVGLARVSSHTFAEIFNSFIEPISYKAWFVTFAVVVGYFAITNMAFMVARNKIHPFQQQQHDQPSQHFLQQNPFDYTGPPQYTPHPERNTMALAQVPEPYDAYDNRQRSPSKEYRIGSSVKNNGSESPSKRSGYS